MFEAVTKNRIEENNKSFLDEQARDYDYFQEKLLRTNNDINLIKKKINNFNLALPSWGLGTGGTRFGRFPGIGDPNNIFQKIEDSAVINDLMGATNSVSPHFPWDNVDDYKELKDYANKFDLKFDLVNSNTFQDQTNQEHSYKFGSLTNNSKKIRDKATEFNIECIRKGKLIGSKGLTVWIGDGGNYPGQQNFSKSLNNYMVSMKDIYSNLPDDWKILLEYKPYEPAFYSTVVNDWGTSYICAKELGQKAMCLIDLGHHLPNTNIEMIVSRLIDLKKLGGFHFNDSQYGDDDLDSGSINPHQLFLIFNELTEEKNMENFNKINYMIDQSHNLTDPIESLIQSTNEILVAYAKSLLVDKAKLESLQNDNDIIGASNLLKVAFNTDVYSLLKQIRLENHNAINPIFTYRKLNYKNEKAKERKNLKTPSPGII
jgi:L-rhamnose isomerase/sugar isomerase|tara:strand:- start:1157 stop:2446 length:1290 start_codon:yes stop_codon:yes gene_type:complete